MRVMNFYLNGRVVLSMDLDSATTEMRLVTIDMLAADLEVNASEISTKVEYRR